MYNRDAYKEAFIMTPNLVRLACIGLFSLTTAVSADKSYNWTDNLPPVEVFGPVF
jgi:hypothetical protein